MKARMRSDTVRTHFIFGLIVNGDIFQTNILTFMICNYLVKILIRFYLWVCVCVFVLACLYIYSVRACSAHRDQKQAPNPPETGVKRWSRVPQCVGAGNWTASALLAEPSLHPSLYAAFVLCFFLVFWVLLDISEMRIFQKVD